jgi:hypothetical protein
MLKVNEAKGRRKYVRANCASDPMSHREPFGLDNGLISGTNLFISS